MAECPICRRPYDARFQVFVPSLAEPFDTVACARRAAAAWGAESAAAAALLLPTIEVVPPRPVAAAAAPPRRGAAALAAFAVSPAQAALATGVGLFAAGTAASIYLWTQSTTHAPPVAVPTQASQPAQQTQPSRPLQPQRPQAAGGTSTRHARTHHPRTSARRGAHAKTRRLHVAARQPTSVRPAASSATASAAPATAPLAKPAAPSSAEAQYGSYTPPFKGSS